MPGAKLGTLEHVRKVIAPANGDFCHFVKDDKQQMKNLICWEIPFTVNHNGWDVGFSAWVAASTGKMIGGNSKHN